MARSVDYDRIAGTYDRRYEYNDYSGVEAALIAFVGEHLRPARARGWLRHRPLASSPSRGRGIRVAGLDASAQMLSYAKARAPGAVLAQGSAERLPWTH